MLKNSSNYTAKREKRRFEEKKKTGLEKGTAHFCQLGEKKLKRFWGNEGKIRGEKKNEKINKKKPIFRAKSHSAP